MSVSAETSRERWDLAAAVLLALAAVCTSWSGYQAARWNGEQATAFSRAGAVRVESAKADGLANSQSEVDVATFTQWVDAYARGETVLVDFYGKRFRAEFKPAVEAWTATRPLQNPDAPLTPFAMPEYQLQARADAERLEAQAEALSATARENLQRATNYVLCVVVFSAVLFFAGMSTKMGSRRASRLLLVCAIVLFVGAVATLATFPVSLSV